MGTKGKCELQKCKFGWIRIKGKCMKKCNDDQERINGKCVKACKVTEERVNGKCKTKCRKYWVRNDEGNCESKVVKCRKDQKKVDNHCFCKKKGMITRNKKCQCRVGAKYNAKKKKCANLKDV